MKNFGSGRWDLWLAFGSVLLFLTLPSLAISLFN